MPFIKSRFGSESVIVDEHFFLAECRLGSLLKLLRCGVPIAGVILQRVNTQLSSVWVGFSPAQGRSDGNGASDVLDYFTFEYALQQGCRSVDLGPSRPLLNDGLFCYQRNWGAQARLPKLAGGDILLRPIKCNRAVQSAMMHNHWITRERGKLAGQLLVEGQTMTPEELHTIAKHRGSGIECIKLQSCPGFSSAVMRAAEGMPGVSLTITR